MSLQKPFEAGEEVWLTPRTLWALGIAYKQPHGIIAAAGRPLVTVTLDDGQTVEIHFDNVTRTPPSLRKERKTAPKPPPPQCDGTANCPLHTTARAAHPRHVQAKLW